MHSGRCLAIAAGHTAAVAAVAFSSRPPGTATSSTAGGAAAAGGAGAQPRSGSASNVFFISGSRWARQEAEVHAHRLAGMPADAVRKLFNAHAE